MTFVSFDTDKGIVYVNPQTVTSVRAKVPTIIFTVGGKWIAVRQSAVEVVDQLEKAAIE